MIIDTKVRELLIEIRRLLETGIENCFGVMALCKNCEKKCNKEKLKQKLKNKIDDILEV